MKLLSFELDGVPSWGALVDGQVLDLRAATEGRVPTLRAALAAMSLQQIAALAAVPAPRVAPGRITFLPVIPDPAKILCIGLNYDAHRVEAKRDTTAVPTVFVRFAASQIGHGQPIAVPPESDKLDYEGEIAIVIGKGGRRIAEADAWQHIAGYAPYNDGSVRDWQAHTTQWTAGKNFSRTGGFGR